jgi:hypothetical protein
VAAATPHQGRFDFPLLAYCGQLWRGLSRYTDRASPEGPGEHRVVGGIPDRGDLAVRGGREGRHVIPTGSTAGHRVTPPETESGPADGRNRAAPARRPSPPAIVATPHPGLGTTRHASARTTRMSAHRLLPHHDQTDQRLRLARSPGGQAVAGLGWRISPGASACGAAGLYHVERRAQAVLFDLKVIAGLQVQPEPFSWSMVCTLLVISSRASAAAEWGRSQHADHAARRSSSAVWMTLARRSGLPGGAGGGPGR